jgi:hypothetical protein
MRNVPVLLLIAVLSGCASKVVEPTKPSLRQAVAQVPAKCDVALLEDFHRSITADQLQTTMRCIRVEMAPAADDPQYWIAAQALNNEESLWNRVIAGSLSPDAATAEDARLRDEMMAKIAASKPPTPQQQQAQQQAAHAEAIKQRAAAMCRLGGYKEGTQQINDCYQLAHHEVLRQEQADLANLLSATKRP